MKLRLLLSVFAFSLGVMIVGVSLLTMEAISAGENNIASKELYIGQVLPDHIAYPLLMVMDRFYLETADEKERIYKQIEYSNRRLFYTQTLLAQGDAEKLPLALSTLTKAEKYLIKACLESMELTAPDKTTKDIVLRSLIHHHGQLGDLAHKFTDSQRSILDELRKEEKALMEQLDN
ncbi:MAG: hypothetical protein ABFQ62_05535 [Patescibacteria group bacterium]